MRIERMLLQRYCQYVDRTLEFAPGMNVIVGPIGSGKSNILKGIRFAFTNDSGNAGNRDEDITFGSAAGDRSGIQLVGVHKDNRFTIKRFIKPSSRELQWDGSSIVLRSEKAIADDLYAKIGIDPAMFDEFIVVPQGQLSSIIDMKDADRTEAMQKLVGLQKYSRMHAWLGTYLSSISAPFTLEDADAILSRLQRLEAEEKLMKVDLEVAMASRVSPEEVLAATKVYNDRNSSVALRVKIDGLQQSKDTLLSKRTSLSEAAARDSVAIAAKKEELKLVTEELARVTTELQQATLYSSKLSLESYAKSLQEVPPEPVAPVEGYIPPGVDMVKDQREAMAVLRHVQALVSRGVHSCPTCLRPVTAEMAQTGDKIKQLQVILDSHDQAVSASRKYDSLMVARHEAIALRDVKLPEIQAQLAAIGDLAVPAERPERLMSKEQQLKSQLVAVRRAAEAGEESNQHMLQQIASLSGQIDAMSNQLTELRLELESKSGTSEEAFSAAMAVLAKDEDSRARIANRQGSLSVLSKQIPAEKSAYEAAVAAKAKVEKTLAFRQHVSAARELFHRDQLPAEMAKNGMLAVAAQMNEALSAFGANYRVSCGNGSSFNATFFNEGVKGQQSDTRLSGGERAQFGLALRVASHSLWAQDLGFLALDEPTYGFGQNDMKCVEIAIEQLRSLSRSQGLQVIVVTHEKSLLHLFDHVIPVGV